MLSCLYLFFSKLLNKEASNTVLPKLTVFTGSASAANAVHDSVTTTKTISGGKGMFSTVKAKVIAGVCAAAVVGGGITAAVVLSSNGSKDNDNDDGVVVVTESQKAVKAVRLPIIKLIRLAITVINTG